MIYERLQYDTPQSCTTTSITISTSTSSSTASAIHYVYTTDYTLQCTTTNTGLDFTQSTGVRATYY